MLGGVAMGFRLLPQTMGKQGGKALSCFHLPPEWSGTWKRVKMSLWPCCKCGQNVYPRHVPAVAPADSKAQVFCCDGELAVACTAFCLLERHGHTEGIEGLVKMPTLYEEVADNSLCWGTAVSWRQLEVGLPGSFEVVRLCPIPDGEG